MDESRVHAPLSANASTYLYCVVAHDGPALELERAPAGVSAHPARVVCATAPLWLVATSVSLSEYAPSHLEHRLRDPAWVAGRTASHDAVVEHCAERAPVVPARPFALFKDESHAVAHVARRRDALLDSLARLAGCAEWAVRISAGGLSASGRARAVSDTLLRGAARAFDALHELARESRREAPAPGEVGFRIVLDAAFLVAPSESARFVATLEHTAEQLRVEGCDVRIRGPAAPHRFAVLV